MNMEAELKNVNEQLKDNKLEKFATACDTAGTKMESFGKKMSVVSAGIAGIGAASIKVEQKFVKDGEIYVILHGTAAYIGAVHGGRHRDEGRIWGGLSYNR